MKPIIFFDTEVDFKSKRILDIGALKGKGNTFHSNSISGFEVFLGETQFICGHNIINHDLEFLQKRIQLAISTHLKPIDTLFLSPLLFPAKPYHCLLKDDKLQTDELNNPLNDSIKARDLFFDECNVFTRLATTLKNIYYHLLKDQNEFKHFFDYQDYKPLLKTPLLNLIGQQFEGQFCENAFLEQFISKHPIELAYVLALINCTDRYSITPPWVLINYPEVARIMFLLRSKPCLTGCKYCDEALNVHKGLQDFFGYDTFRKFDDKPLQEIAVKAAIENESLLAVFPTGGGKSLSFQVPALLAGRSTKGLTVVISPLQSLMKDQVDNLERNGITEAVTINGLLDPIERMKSFERVYDGSASMLYISPESLRSKTIEKLLLGRQVVRFVIDEAHCFSAWGQDFRVDYLYIGDFIKALQTKKSRSESIPVSCFTATAKQNVIEDILDYFKEKLSLNLKVLRANTSRKNLQYKVFNSSDEHQKYSQVRSLVESKNCPTIIYVSRTRRAYNLAERLNKDGFRTRAYYGKMDRQEKTENQDAFMEGEVQIMVATSAFGMGVDKKDVGLVIHYDISDSLENYIQEAGRAGRDENITADCFVLFNDDDLSKHFILLNQTKLSVREIQQVWRAIKYITNFRSSISSSALEIARKAGWDDNVNDIETRVKTAIAALENAGYLKRGQNMPRIYANSILTKNAQQAIDKIMASTKFTQSQEVNAIRIIKKLFSTKSKKHANEEEAEARVDYISDQLGIVKEVVIKIISLLREEEILADTKDLTAFIKRDDAINRSLSIVESYAKLENFLLPFMDEEKKILNLKELNEEAIANGISTSTPNKIKTVFNFWSIKNWIKRKYHHISKNSIGVISLQPRELLQSKLEKRHSLSIFIVKHLFNKMLSNKEKTITGDVLIEFSVHELKDQYIKASILFNLTVEIDDVEDALFYLSRIESIKIEGGFLVVYNKLTINRLEKNNAIQYKKDDYQQLNQFYQNKMQQIHIVGEYATKMLEDYEKALQFVEDYFQLNYPIFLRKYFPGSRLDEIQMNITPKKFKQLFGSLSPSQLKIINNKKTKYIMVAAGPGSGKTRVLVHKLASLMLMEDVKHEQLLMLTFSRAAASEFKKRLLDLIGNAANFIEIKTFHSYCFDLLGRVGSIDKSAEILQTTVKKIKENEVEQNKITKSVLVIDEAQDMDAHEYALIEILMKKNEEMRVIAVGDDDQNIYAFRGANSKYFEQYNQLENSIKYELIENYRSKSNLVLFSNKFLASIQNRIKEMPIVPIQKNNGTINVFEYTTAHLIEPLIKDVLNTDLSGTTGILTKTNQEALQITGLLLKNNIPAKLIQSNDQFNLINLSEIRSFIEDLALTKDTAIINIDVWNKAKRSFAKKHSNSNQYELCKMLLVTFQETNPKTKFVSDFKVFIKESKLEDFVSQSSGVINVSTIHKAKGKEFDNVFLMLSDYHLSNDDDKRQLYVAITRAKQNLSIHYNGKYFANYDEIENLKFIQDNTNYALPKQLMLQLNHRDINLGYFGFIQHRVNELKSGDQLQCNDEAILNSSGKEVAKFSKNFLEEKLKLEKQGFVLKAAKVNFILYWKNEEEKEVKIILPELCFERKLTNFSD